MSALPRVSVLMPTYNQEQFVGEAVESVLAQDYPNFELVVSDDGSTDSTPKLLRRYERDGAKVHLNEANAGIPDNFNLLLRVATGSYLAWLAGDDLMLPGKLSTQVDLLESNAAASSCFHDAMVFDSVSGADLGLFSRLYNGAPGLREGGMEVILDPTYRLLPSTMMFRAAATPEGGFDSRLRYASDWLFAIEVFARGGCVTSDEPLTRYRRHPGNVTASAHAERAGFEESLMAMALAEARLPRIANRTRAVRSALMLGEARRRWGRSQRRAGLAYGRAALGSGGPGGALRLAGQLLASERRRRAAARNSS